MNTCNLCENPYPYVCEACQKQMEQAFAEDDAMFQNTQQEPRRVFIGSGEDVCLEMLS